MQRHVDPRDAKVREPRMPQLRGGIVGLCEQSGMWKGFEGIMRAVPGEWHFITIGEDEELLVVDHGADAIVLVSPSARGEKRRGPGKPRRW